jgi:hypothetical protein
MFEGTVVLATVPSSISHHAADDVAQEVCLALMSARHGWQHGLSTGRTVTAYAFGIAAETGAVLGMSAEAVRRGLFACGSTLAGQGWRHGIL